MAQFKAFDPDPDLTDPEDPDFGTGTWHYADGGSTYGQGDRDEAMALYKPPTQPDERTAAVSPYGQDDQMTPKVPGQEALEANAPLLDIPPPAPGVPEKAPGGSEPSASGVDIPKTSRIAYVHNNPGNLKYVGQDGAHEGEPAQDGGHWAAFETPEEGVAALSRQLDIDAGKGKTLKDFIGKYAPPGSNDTAGYIQQATQQLGADENTKISDIPHDRLLSFVANKESGTKLGASGLPPQTPQRAPMPNGLPAAMGNMQASVAEVKGQPLTPDQIAGRQQSIYDQTAAQLAGVQQSAAARQQGRNEAFDIVSKQSEAFKADQQRQLQQATAAKLEAQQNVESAMATQLDPGRVVKNMSTGDMVLGAIALISSTLGNALAMSKGQKQVSATGWIEKAINDDLEQQKEDKRSRVAHWTNVFKDQEMGEKAARAEMYNAAGKMAEYQANTKAANADIQAQMMQDSATLIAKGQAETQGILDKETERVTVKYQTPDPKNLGGVETLQKQLAARKAYEDAGATPEQLHGFDMAMGIPSPGGESERQQKTRETNEGVARDAQKSSAEQAKAADAKGAIEAHALANGLIRDPKTNQWVEGPGWMPPALGEGLLGGATPAHDAADAAVEAYGRFRSGGVIGPDERKDFGEQMGLNTRSRAQLASKLNAAEKTIGYQMTDLQRKKTSPTLESAGFRKATP